MLQQQQWQHVRPRHNEGCSGAVRTGQQVKTRQGTAGGRGRAGHGQRSRTAWSKFKVSAAGATDTQAKKIFVIAATTRGGGEA